MADLEQLAARLTGDVLTAQEYVAPYLSGWRGLWTGRARAVICPRHIEDVVEVMRWCQQTDVPIVPQGGNTGLSGGATPDQSGDALVLSLEKLNCIRSFDAQANVLEVEAGATLMSVQEEAAQHGQIFPLSIAAEGSCQIGGILATNAGGIYVFRYGQARNLCLGVEVVLSSGEVWRGTQTLFKNNTGYALRDLFIGSEGTLGIITAASLRLFPRPQASVTIFLGVDDLQAACDIYANARVCFGPELTACELLSSPCVSAVLSYRDRLRFPLKSHYRHYVLIEISSWESEQRARKRSFDWLEARFNESLIADATLSTSEAQFRALWELREYVSEAQSANRPVIKHDISVPLSQIVAFDGECIRTLLRTFPDIAVEPFGHLGDGNLHYNVVPQPRLAPDIFSQRQKEINQIVHDLVDRFGGSISAEHGLGVLRRDEAARYRSAAETKLMRAIKNSFDPLGLMNPGKVLAKNQN